MRNERGQFIQGNSGKPKGSKHKLTRRTLIELLNRITEDFDENYSSLTTNQKIKLLTSFKGFYVEERNKVEIQPSEGVNFNELIKSIRNG